MIMDFSAGPLYIKYIFLSQFGVLVKYREDCSLQDEDGLKIEMERVLVISLTYLKISNELGGDVSPHRIAGIKVVFLCY